MSTPVARLARSSAVHIQPAFVAMGGRAVFANGAHPIPAPLLAGIAQGALSACLISASLLTLIHTLSGTPEVLATIVLPLMVATRDAALYKFSLWQAGRR